MSSRSPCEVRRKQGDLCGNAWLRPQPGTSMDMKEASGSEKWEGVENRGGRMVEVWEMCMAILATVAFTDPFYL